MDERRPSYVQRMLEDLAETHEDGEEAKEENTLLDIYALPYKDMELSENDDKQVKPDQNRTDQIDSSHVEKSVEINKNETKASGFCNESVENTGNDPESLHKINTDKTNPDKSENTHENQRQNRNDKDPYYVKTGAIAMETEESETCAGDMVGNQDSESLLTAPRAQKNVEEDVNAEKIIADQVRTISDETKEINASSNKPTATTENTSNESEQEVGGSNALPRDLSNLQQEEGQNKVWADDNEDITKADGAAIGENNEIGKDYGTDNKKGNEIAKDDGTDSKKIEIAKADGTNIDESTKTSKGDDITENRSSETTKARDGTKESERNEMRDIPT
ncbi:uncharacterized protein DDB_G0283697 isoform X2 [Nematostella vectensis]|nr:uncharacterized protein DDB_G0283697 isoform X2 [Nematostella vectensis]XP_048587203.1 uncharacterized protein DDB_G0283697 isoform X2 [Nematostella vectensis]